MLNGFHFCIYELVFQKTFWAKNLERAFTNLKKSLKMLIIVSEDTHLLKLSNQGGLAHLARALRWQ